MIAQHSSLTNEAYTPALIVEPARATLERIDLDPASCALGNEVVRAGFYLNEEDNGLFRTWRDQSTPERGTRVFLNPPGGKLDPETFEPFKAGRVKADGKKCSAADGVSAAAVWWAKLHSEWEAGNVEQAIFVAFTLSVFRTAQSLEGVPAPYEFPFVVPRERINYDKVEMCERYPGEPAEPVRVPSKGAPGDGAIVYLPPKAEWERNAHGPSVQRFSESFARLGRLRV